MSGQTRRLRLPGVVFHETSANSKLAASTRVPYPHKQFRFRPTPRAPFCSATYVSIKKTCSDSCAFKGRGCYVQEDHFMRRAIERLDLEAGEADAFEVALNEVDAIDSAFRRGVPQDGARGGRDLRLHVGGDTPGKGAAVLLGEAAARWRARGGGRVWSFTHAWREIPRASFGRSLSVLASVETATDAKRAIRRGYVPAIVVDTFPGRRVFEVEGVKFIPCPNETSGRTCVDCRLCLDDGPLRDRGMGIAFAVHGMGAGEIRETLTQLGRRRAA